MPASPNLERASGLAGCTPNPNEPAARSGRENTLMSSKHQRRRRQQPRADDNTAAAAFLLLLAAAASSREDKPALHADRATREGSRLAARLVVAGAEGDRAVADALKEAVSRAEDGPHIIAAMGLALELLASGYLRSVVAVVNEYEARFAEAHEDSVASDELIGVPRFANFTELALLEEAAAIITDIDSRTDA
jgi:hypothetical protein